MGKGKPPAFQMYAADFLVDTNGWSVKEVGVYLRLLLTEWVNGPLPDDPDKLARIAQCSRKVFDQTWLTVSQKFEVNSNRQLTNRRMETERALLEEYVATQREHGRKGANRRWEKDRVAHRVAHQNPNGNPNGETIALQSSYSSTSKKHSTKHQSKTPEASLAPEQKTRPSGGLFEKEPLIKERSDEIKQYWPQVYKWIGSNQKAHPGAVLKILDRLKKELQAGVIRSPWSYATKILNVENGNFHEADAIARHELLKKQTGQGRP